MSRHTQLLKDSYKLIPPLANARHKGQSGRVGVIGGSLEYTGAPFFSAISALKLGADLGHIICERSAALAIKTYSPEIIVHPLLRASSDPGSDSADIIADRIKELLPRLHSLVVGPGLSRDPLMLETTKIIIIEARRLDLPLVLDADGLYLIQNEPSLISGYKNAVLTPNVVEFERLSRALSLDIKKHPTKERARVLSEALGGVSVLQKGPTDLISNGEEIFESTAPGGLKRCGGQGDVLSGVLGVFMAWAALYRKRDWEHDESISTPYAIMLACWASSHITRSCSQAAYAKYGRATQAADLIPEIGPTFRSNYESE